ncbi:MAG: hypothetical protein COB60_06965 [Flavobacteriaceae bacterium]|nr:MAG: hypothetical protein COB60_06965 [Flavobacteriaceae bacterium]
MPIYTRIRKNIAQGLNIKASPIHNPASNIFDFTRFFFSKLKTLLKAISRSRFERTSDSSCMEKEKNPINKTYSKIA